MSDERGWMIFEKFYAHVGWDALTYDDFALVRQLTGLTTDEFMNGEDLRGNEHAWVAIAFLHGNPDMTRDQVARIIGQVKPVDVRPVGFTITGGDDAGPPAGAEEEPSAPSSETGAGSSSETPNPPSAQVT